MNKRGLHKSSSLFYFRGNDYICIMFRTQAQIDDIVTEAKAYLYENLQGVSIVYQSRVGEEAFNTYMNSVNNAENLIKSIEFIGSNLQDNNKLVEELQGIIGSAMFAKEYVENGYVENGYFKYNPS